MSKDYRQKAPRTERGGGLLLGLFIGFLLGMGLAAAIAIYLFKTPIPFLHKANPPEKAVPGSSGLTEPPRSRAVEAPKPRFDFYRILPGQEETITEQQMKQAAQAATKAGTPPKETYFLQAGAFQNPADADNLKAELALMGLEASVEPTNLPDKGVVYRVRLGPYSSVEVINRTRKQLAENGVDASLVKVREPANN